MVEQYRAFWNIPNAGPSVSTFHYSDPLGDSAQKAADTIRAFFAALASILPDTVSIDFDTEVAEIDAPTGQLTGVRAVTAPANVAGSNTGVWSGAAGGRIVWGTSDIRRGRRVRGSTFIVPFYAGGFNDSGRLAGATLTLMNTAANNFLTSMNGGEPTSLVVYSRPVPGFPGAISVVETAATSETPATLRGRKY